MKKINKITEKNNLNSKDIDQKNIDRILEIMNKEDTIPANAIKASIPEISNFITKTIQCLSKKGRLIYIGSGTSGRLGVLDASECPPTFGVSKNLVIGIIAGGDKALKESIEGAEDSSDDSIGELKKINFNSKDIILGISASGTTPFVLSALRYAKTIGASTGFLTCNNIDSIEYVDYLITIMVGPEILGGSTRLKSGTVTKMVLNMISTTAMMKLNRTFGNVMIDLLPKNKKLIKRAVNIIMDYLSLSEEKAKELYGLSEDNLKVAILMGKRNISMNKAKKILKMYNGSLRDSLDRDE